MISSRTRVREIEVFYLPLYSPDPHPEERLNTDPTKHRGVGSKLSSPL